MTSQRIRIVLLVTVSAMALGVPGYGQAAGPTGEDQMTLETVVVTATKRSEDVQKVPMTVAAIGDQQIKDLKLFTLSDIQALTPGLVITNPDGRSNNTTVRGISYNPDSAANAVVDYYWNETPVSAFSASKSMYDMGDVEVLRGPQGTLRALASPGGAIILKSHKPDMDQFGAGVTQSVSDWGLVNTEVFANVPIIKDELALRVAALYHQDRESGIKNIITGEKNRDLFGSFRATLEWMPTDNVDVTLVHQEQRDRSVDFRALRGDPTAINPSTGLAWATPGSYGAVTGDVITPDDRVAIDYGPNSVEDDLKATTLTVNFDFGGSTLVSTTGWQETGMMYARSLNAFGADKDYPQTQSFGITGRQITQELRFQSTGERFWDYMIGVFYQANKSGWTLAQENPYSGAFGPTWLPPVEGMPDARFLSPITIVPDGHPGGSSLFTIYTDHRFHITQDDVIELGLRWADNRTKSRELLTTTTAENDLGFPFGAPGTIPSFVCPFYSFPIAPGVVADGQYFNTAIGGVCEGSLSVAGTTGPFTASPLSHKQAWTGTASYTHYFTEDMMAYLSFGRSWRPSVFTSLTPQPAAQPNLDQTGPETSNGYELGAKGSFFNHRLVVNADIFYQAFTNYINQGEFAYSASYATGGFPMRGGSATCSSVAACATLAAAARNPALAGDTDSGTGYFPYGGDMNTRGVELQMTGLIAEGWTGGLNAAWARARYQGIVPCNDYNGDGIPDSNLTTSMIPGSPAVQQGRNFSLCHSKLPISDAPAWSLSLNTEYATTLFTGIGGYIRALYSILPATNDPLYGAHTPGRHNVNLYLGIRDDESARWDVSVWAKNLFDQTAGQTGGKVETFGVGGQASMSSGYIRSLTMMPREIGLTLSYKFGQ